MMDNSSTANRETESIPNQPNEAMEGMEEAMEQEEEREETSSNDGSSTPTDEYEYTERLRRLLQIERNLSDDFRSALNEEAWRFLDYFTPDARKFFDYDLNADIHSEEDVRTLIRCIPSVLETDEEDRDFILLHSLANKNRSASFIPVVADEAIRINYYNPRYRGGLLYEDYANWTVIQKLCWKSSQTCRDVIRRLRDMNLLKKEDIRGQDLLFINLAGDPELIDFFSDWDPGALKTKSTEKPFQVDGNISKYLKYPHHYCLEIYEDMITGSTPECSERALVLNILKPLMNAGFKHHPDELGLLTLRNHQGETVWDKLKEAIGTQETWKMITNCFDATGNDKVLEEESSGQDPEVSFAPLFTAAASEGLTDVLNILYHLLRQEPAQWISYLEEADSEVDSEPGSKRSRDDEVSHNVQVPLALEQQEVLSDRVSKRSKAL